MDLSGKDIFTAFGDHTLGSHSSVSRFVFDRCCPFMRPWAAEAFGPVSDEIQSSQTAKC